MTSSSTTEVKYDFTPAQPEPGDDYDKWRQRALNAMASGDERGWSLADHVLGIDENGPAGPAIPGGAAGVKAMNLFRTRQKTSYKILTKHVLDGDHITEMTNSHFQNGHAAWLYLEQCCQRPINQLRIRELNKEFDDIDIIHDIGINQNTIKSLAKTIRTVNGKRPMAPVNLRKTPDEMGDKFLEVLFSTSKHFSEGALIEYNEVPANRQYVLAGGPNAGQRDLTALETHYHALWSQAVQSGLPGFHLRAPVGRTAPARRQTVEQGLVSTEMSAHELAYAGDGESTYVPRPGSPSRTLSVLSDVGGESEFARFADTRGTVTTTDWTLLNPDELCQVADSGSIDGEGEAALVFDNDDAASLEIVCNNCQGLGHIGRVCPSSKKFRSVAYAIATLQSRMDRKPTTMRRPPGRGQRPPFRSQPRYSKPRQPVGTIQRAASQMPSFSKRTQQRARSAEEGESEESSEQSCTASEIGSSASSASSRTRSTLSSPPGSALSMPQSFLTDDQLYAEEQGRVGIEEEPTVDEPRVASGWVKAGLNLSPIRTAVTFALAAIAIAVTRGMDLITRVASVSFVIIVMLATVVPRVDTYSTGMEHGFFEMALETEEMAGPVKACVDSGCTSTAVPEHLGWLLDEVTDPSPVNKLKIADDKALDILKIGKSKKLKVMGWKPENKTKLIEDTIPCSRMLVVRGMRKDLILLSTRGMQRDGVNTYLNDDNSVKTADCLKLPTGVVVSFIPSNHSYNLWVQRNGEAGQIASEEQSDDAAHVAKAQSHRMMANLRRRL